MRKGNLGNPKAKQNSIRPAPACPRRSRLSKGRRNCSYSRWPRGGESGIGASGIPGLGHGVDRASIMANGIGTQRCTRDEAESGKGGERSEAQKGFHGRRRGVVGPGASLTLQDRNCGTFDGPRSSANQLWGLRVLAQTDDGIWGAERRRPRDVDRGHLRRGARWSFPPSPRVGDRS